MYKSIGIDISKATFDVFIFETKSSHVFSNDASGFKKLLKKCDAKTLVVMEASGPYHVPLATFLHRNEIAVSVVNPLVIKRYSQMSLQRAKTDKKDAKVIAEYADIYKPKQWKPESKSTISIKQIFTAIELFEKQLRQSKNQLDAFKSSGYTDKAVLQSLNLLIKTIEKKKESLNKELIALTAEHHGGMMERITTIPGVGNKTAALLIAITDGFEKFENHKQLAAYIGFSPRVFQSGTSVRGKGHICKMGKAQIRKLLYLCSWTAKRYNRACVDMKERLVLKGKPNKVINIAIANKLLKQAFAIAKGDTGYNENYSINSCF